MTSVRIWVPGCSTGEEAYSLAISLVEFLGKKAANIPIQIFATDLSDEVINKARSGRYPENIARISLRNVWSASLSRMDGGYQVSKSIREMCVFAKHDLTRDPPFSNLDLISCRNVLIYLGPVLQKRAMSGFSLFPQTDRISPAWEVGGDRQVPGSLCLCGQKI